jgi:hypothetical protein
MLSISHEISLSLDFASATIAIVALLISFIVSRRQARVAFQNLRLQRDNAIIQWSNRALDYFCSAEMILKQEYHSLAPQAEYEKVRLGIMRDISSCADQGRLFFPNIPDEKHGRDRPAAFQGYRHPVLGCLVNTYRLLGNVAPRQDVQTFEADRNKVINFRQHFISLVQTELDPRGLGEFLKAHLADEAKVTTPKKL